MLRTVLFTLLLTHALVALAAHVPPHTWLDTLRNTSTTPLPHITFPCRTSSHPSLSPSVNPFIGSGGDGYGVAALNPGAQVPFGVMRLGPDTGSGWLRLPWRNFGGYSYCDDVVHALSHTHMVGAGASDLGNLGVLPVLRLNASSVTCANRLPAAMGDYMRACSFYLPFTHAEEEAGPGRYSLVLRDRGLGSVNVSLAATSHVGVHRYQWTHEQPSTNGSSKQVIVFDLCHLLAFNVDQCPNATVTIDPHQRTLSGSLVSKGSFSSRYGGFVLFFAVNVSQPLSSFGVWDSSSGRGELFAGRASIVGPNTGAYVEVDRQVADVVEMAVAISFLSVEQAWKNMRDELPAAAGGWYDATLAQAERAWRSVLDDRVQVTGGSQDDRTKFFTALFHSYDVPTRFTEAGGVYRSFTRKSNAHADGFDVYTDLSIWDTFRSHFPLLTLLEPGVAGDMVQTMLTFFNDTGALPKWVLLEGETGSMIGLHSVVMLADAMLAGIDSTSGGKRWSVDEALHAVAVSLRAREGAEYQRVGFWPSQVSKTLAFSLDDFCAATMARAAGNTSMAADFARTSEFWRNNWNTDVQFFCPRLANGTWEECDTKLWPLLALNPWDNHYTEGNAWHWRWFVPQNMSALVELFDSPEAFVKELDTFFSLSQLDEWNFLPNPMYWAGNEIDLQSVFGFIFAGRPDLTQRYVRWIMEHKFTTATDGISGNDDYGAMSSWFALNAMGIYPLHCQGKFALGSPLFDSVSLKLPGGRQLAIVAHGNSKENVYVSKALWNGEEVDGWTIDAKELAGGGKLEFFMASSAH